jgi:hypothetical protein
MKTFAVVAICLASFGAYGADQPASDASIRQLFEVTQTKRLMDGMMAQMDTMMQNAMKQSMETSELTPEQQVIIDDMRTKLMALVRDELKWELVEPQYLEIYRRSFTEQEVVGMLDFYRSIAGQAMITKMPLVMQESIDMAQRHMSKLIPKLQQLQKETLEQISVCCATEAN